jgi:hypothetical protein
MGEKAASQSEYAKFSGMISTVDPRDVPPGQAVLQINLSVSRPGEANVRHGLKELTFETVD